MSRRIVISNLARKDIAQACAWYKNNAQGTDERLVREVDDASARIQDRPRAFPEVEPDVRLAMCDTFPYKVFYMIEPAQIVILAVYHGKRDPSRWKIQA